MAVPSSGCCWVVRILVVDDDVNEVENVPVHWVRVGNHEVVGSEVLVVLFDFDLRNARLQMVRYLAGRSENESLLLVFEELGCNYHLLLDLKLFR